MAMARRTRHGRQRPDVQNLLQLQQNTSLSQLQKDVQSFYAAREFRPAWTGGSANEDMAADAAATLARASQQGLRVSDYGAGLTKGERPPERGADGAKRDVALTEALFRYAYDVRLGRVRADDFYNEVRLPAASFDPAAALNDALGRRDIEEFLADLPPPQPEYLALVGALARYQAIAAAGGWPVVKGAGEIVPGQNDPREQALVRRLALEDPARAGGLAVNDDDLHGALTRFQIRNGLPADGRAGPDTLRELNVPVAARIRQIVANMERWRWMPRALERRYIRVNVPDQSLDYISDGEIVLHSRVNIGKKTTPTPILRMDVVAIIANPSSGHSRRRGRARIPAASAPRSRLS